MNKSEFKRYASQYRDEFHSVAIPVPFKDKIPLIGDWRKYQGRELSDREIAEMVDGYADTMEMNMALLTDNVVVVDIDSEAGYAKVKELGLDLEGTKKVKTRKGEHLYYKAPANVRLNNAVKFIEDVDIRTFGGYVIAPPSVHATGHVYEWVNPDTPVAPLPDIIVEKFMECKKRPKKEKAQEFVPLSYRLHEGSRNAEFTRLAGSLRNMGFTPEAIKLALDHENNNSTSPLDESELDTIIRSVTRYDIAGRFYTFNDVGNGQRLSDRYADNTLYCSDTSSFFHFADGIWKNDDSQTNAIMRGKAVARLSTIINECEGEDDEMVEAYEKWQSASLNTSRINNAITECTPALIKPFDLLDGDENLFNFANCTYELDKRIAREACPLDYLTKRSPVTFDPVAKSPLWEKFLNTTFQGNAEMLNYIQKCAGYCLASGNPEQVFFMLTGSGGNGKSVFCETLSHVLGDYAGYCNIETFMRNSGELSKNDDLASVKGARAIFTSEIHQGKTLDDSLIKQISGGEQLKVRFLRGRYFSYYPTYKLWMSTNNEPQIRDYSDGIWRRMKRIPFMYKVPKEERDNRLTEKLHAEASGILNWVLEGFRMWQSEGLGTCSIVEEETAYYRQDQDPILAFLETKCVEMSGARIAGSDLNKAFHIWQSENDPNNNTKYDNKYFFALLRRHNYTIERGKGNKAFVTGLTLKSALAHVENNIIAPTF